MRAVRWAAVGAVAGLVALAPPASAADEPPAPPQARSAATTGARPGPTPDVQRPHDCHVEGTYGAPGSDLAGRLRLDAVHRIATGSGVTVAVIDTGVAPSAAFGERLSGGGDYVEGGDGLDDCDGHGTAVAGLVAARATTDDAGTAEGIAPGARVISIRQSTSVYTSDGKPVSVGTTTTLAAAVVLAVREGAKVINISEVSCLPATDGVAVRSGDVLHAALDLAAQQDVVVVAAAGNIESTSISDTLCGDPAVRKDQVSLPGWYDDDVLTVGSVDEIDAPAAYTVPGPWVDVAAPGEWLRSIGTDGKPVGGLRGTSFAAPIVSGLAALVRQRYPELSAKQVVDRITATARRPSSDSTEKVGRGVVDPLAALTAIPAVLVADARRPAATATLPGTVPRSAPPAAGFPVDLAVAVVFGVACVAGAQRLRRR